MDIRLEILENEKKLHDMKKKWIIGDDGDREWLCEHGVGHSKGVHTCCHERCCMTLIKPKPHKKFTKKQIKAIRGCWDKLRMAQSDFNLAVGRIEGEMMAKTGILDIEFFRVNGDYVGCGNTSKTYKLLQAEEIECST